jgi:hypothetical protein
MIVRRSFVIYAGPFIQQPPAVYNRFMRLSQTQNRAKNPTNHDDKSQKLFDDGSASLRANAMDSLRLSVLGGPLRQKDALNIRLLIRLRWLA